jgi:hypothetical protein
MKNGKLMTCGSSLFLKNKFGVGYDLTVIKNDAETLYEPIFDCIQDVIAGAKIISSSGMEMKIRLPIDTLPLFENLFQSIETNMAGLGINNYGISLSTLEQVFINVTNSDAKPADLMDKMVSAQEVELANNSSKASIHIVETKVTEESILPIIGLVDLDTARDVPLLGMFNAQKHVTQENMSPLVELGGLNTARDVTLHGMINAQKHVTQETMSPLAGIGVLNIARDVSPVPVINVKKKKMRVKGILTRQMTLNPRQEPILQVVGLWGNNIAPDIPFSPVINVKKKKMREKGNLTRQMSLNPRQEHTPPIVGPWGCEIARDISPVQVINARKKNDSERKILRRKSNLSREVSFSSKANRRTAVYPRSIFLEKKKTRDEPLEPIKSIECIEPIEPSEPIEPIQCIEPIEPIVELGDKDYLRETRAMAIFRMHFWALTKKKIQYFKRDKKAITCELIVPMLCILFGLGLTLHSWINESPSMDLNASIGGREVTPYNIYYDALSKCEASSLFAGLATNPNLT